VTVNQIRLFDLKNQTNSRKNSVKSFYLIFSFFFSSLTSPGILKTASESNIVTEDWQFLVLIVIKWCLELFWAQHSLSRRPPLILCSFILLSGLWCSWDSSHFHSLEHSVTIQFGRLGTSWIYFIHASRHFFILFAIESQTLSARVPCSVFVCCTNRFSLLELMNSSYASFRSLEYQFTLILIRIISCIFFVLISLSSRLKRSFI